MNGVGGLISRDYVRKTKSAPCFTLPSHSSRLETPSIHLRRGTPTYYVCSDDTCLPGQPNKQKRSVRLCLAAAPRGPEKEARRPNSFCVRCAVRYCSLPLGRRCQKTRASQVECVSHFDLVFVYTRETQSQSFGISFRTRERERERDREGVTAFGRRSFSIRFHHRHRLCHETQASVSKAERWCHSCTRTRSARCIRVIARGRPGHHTPNAKNDALSLSLALAAGFFFQVAIF